MLVLSRQRDETIMIGDDVELTIVDIRGDKVRLGIKAPSHVAVHRKEVYDAIKRENEEAARLDQLGLGSLPAAARPAGARPPAVAPAARLGDGPTGAKKESA
ncbi:MAG: carbon storage regulator CsrA [Planctomycetota bacterium]|jgi:carbon storage regulator